MVSYDILHQDIGITIPDECVPSGHDNSAYESETPHKLNYSSSVKITQPRNTTADHPDLTIVARSSPFCNNKKVGGNVYNVSSASLTSYTSNTSDSDSLSHAPSVATTTSKSDMKSQRTEKKMLTSLRSFLMVVALSIHSIFEGMAIGKLIIILLFSYIILTSFQVCKKQKLECGNCFLLFQSMPQPLSSVLELK
jgi:hypothetical protein